jgi:hypothetical protein
MDGIESKPQTIRAEIAEAQKEQVPAMTYTSAFPCPKGHVVRHVRNGVCAECAKGWRAAEKLKNGEKWRAYNRQYSREYRLKHPQIVSGYVRQWQRTHKEAMKAIKDRCDARRRAGLIPEKDKE